MEIIVHSSWKDRVAVAVLVAIAVLFVSGHTVAGFVALGALLLIACAAAVYIVWDMWAPPEMSLKEVRKGGSSPVNSK